MDASKLAVVQEIKLEPLKIVILDHGEKVRVVEVPDPRVAYLKAFALDPGTRGLVAQPMLWATFFANAICFCA
jgi:hypothetical protein